MCVWEGGGGVGGWSGGVEWGAHHNSWEMSTFLYEFSVSGQTQM